LNILVIETVLLLEVHW